MRQFFELILGFFFIFFASMACVSKEKNPVRLKTDKPEYKRTIFRDEILDSADFEPIRFIIENQDLLKMSQEYATVFFDYESENPLRLRNEEGIKQYSNKPDNDQYFLLSLLSKTHSEYFVIVWDALTGIPLAKGYILKASPLRIFSRVEYLKIYQYPDSLSVSIKDTTRYYSEPIPVIDFSGRWLKIRRNNPGTMNIEGWMSPFEQCPNVFTTCS